MIRSSFQNGILSFGSAISGNLQTTVDMVDLANKLSTEETLDSLMKTTEPVWLTVASLSAMVLGFMVLTPALQPKWQRKNSSNGSVNPGPKPIKI